MSAPFQKSSFEWFDRGDRQSVDEARISCPERGWTDEQLAAGEEQLRARGLLDGDAITRQGREVREAIETSTDAAMAGALDVLGDDIEEILATMEPWGAAIRDAGGYLTPLVRFTFANT